MSDYLSRLAARAVGQVASAQPRLPAVFEKPETASAELEPDIVAEKIAAAPTPTKRQTHAIASPRPAESGERPSAENTEPLPIPVLAERAITPPPSAPASLIHGYDKRSVKRFVETPRKDGAVIPETAVPAMPAARLDVSRVVPAPALAEQEMPQSVRVHIGRLEVRANLQQAPPQRPRPNESLSQELSLADYLRGKRDRA